MSKTTQKMNVMNPNKRPKVEEYGDRYCVSCGWLIRGLAMDKSIVQCPFKHCRKGVPFRAETFGWLDQLTGVLRQEHVMGRCSGSNCGAFVCDLMLYCEHCGTKYAEGAARKERDDHKKIIDQKDEEIKKLRELLKSKEDQEKANATLDGVSKEDLMDDGNFEEIAEPNKE